MAILDQRTRTGRCAKKNSEGGTDRGAALTWARLSVRSMLFHSVPTTVKVVVLHTTTTVVSRVGVRIDLLHECGRANRIKIPECSRKPEMIGVRSRG